MFRSKNRNQLKLSSFSNLAHSRNSEGEKKFQVSMVKKLARIILSEEYKELNAYRNVVAH